MNGHRDGWPGSALGGLAQSNRDPVLVAIVPIPRADVKHLGRVLVLLRHIRPNNAHAMTDNRSSACPWQVSGGTYPLFPFLVTNASIAGGYQCCRPHHHRKTNAMEPVRSTVHRQIRLGAARNSPATNSAGHCAAEPSGSNVAQSRRGHANYRHALDVAFPKQPLISTLVH
jgi:hypothetical protein